MNGRKHLAWLVPALVAAIVLAAAAPAFAATSGTVYGTAELEFYAVTVSGTGSDVAEPLTYVGDGPADKVGEKYASQVTLTNSGTLTGDFRIVAAQEPTNGMDSWSLTNIWDSGTDAAWALNDGTNDFFVTYAPVTIASDVAAGDGVQYGSSFQFPPSISDFGDHDMQATVSITAP